MSTLPEQYRHHEPYFTDLSNRVTELRGARNTSICTDDQGIHGVRFGVQAEGGSYGDARAMDLAMALGASDVKFEPTDYIIETRTIAGLTGGTTHEQCAAMALPRDLDQWMIEHPEELLAGANILAPGLVTEDDVVMAVERIQYRSQFSKIYLPRDTIEQRLAEIDAESDPVPHHKLHHTLGHRGLVCISNDIKDSYHDTSLAYEEGAAAYGFTLHAMGDKALRLMSVFPLRRPEDFSIGRTLNTVAVAANLPNAQSPTGKGIGLAYRGENFAKVA